MSDLLRDLGSGWTCTMNCSGNPEPCPDCIRTRGPTQMTADVRELIERLRAGAQQWHPHVGALLTQAADALEAVEAEREALRADVIWEGNWRARALAAEARAYRLAGELEEAHAAMDEVDPDLSRGDQRILERFAKYARGLNSTGGIARLGREEQDQGAIKAGLP